MKKTQIIFAILALATTNVFAQRVDEDNFSRLRVHYQTEDFTINKAMVDGGTYCTLNIGDYLSGGEIGAPALPQLGSIIEVPVCKGFTVKIENAIFDTVSLTLPVMPMQPSICKSDTRKHSLVIDNSVYSTDGFVGSELAEVEYIGVARDRNIARLVFSPVKVNPVQGKAVICRSADITVYYEGSDEAATIDLFRRYYTPAYSIGTILNNLLSPKYVSNATPVRMAVLTHSSLKCNKLDEFLSWKRQQGLRVDVYYIDEIGILSTAAIASMLTDLYTNASESNPAPAYLLIIGDVAQVPVHASKISGSSYIYNDHYTDLYYSTWSSGDKIPDCYYGRISATDVSTLNNILHKTLYYERYQFSDDSYLARAALIAGVDQSWGNNTNDNAYTYADPAMDYIASFYVNHANGYDSVTYYKNRTSFTPNNIPVTGSCRSSSTANTLRNYYNDGAGWINYSAHGDWNEWSIPEFNVSHANSMSNNGMPSFMIGNCCLSNKFDKGTCLGEALLRKGSNAGAIGYIGGSNYTYWSEDFYWAVGLRNNISGTMTPTYNSNNLGAYDRLFHTHNEALNTTANTAAKMMFYGNMAVQSSGSSFTQYYWEIYHLMGDPTLMPWLGRAEDPYVVINDAGSAIYIGTIRGAYVAVVDPDNEMNVVAATFADASGNATLSVPADHSSMMLSVTVQGHKPYHYRFNNLGIADANMVNAEIWPNPAIGSCQVACKGMQSISITNSLGQTVRTIAAQGDNTTIDLQGLANGIYILRIATEHGIATKKLIVR